MCETRDHDYCQRCGEDRELAGGCKCVECGCGEMLAPDQIENHECDVQVLMKQIMQRKECVTGYIIGAKIYAIVTEALEAQADLNFEKLMG